MTDREAAGTIAGLWRFPVKSMQGERLEQADLTEQGLVGDRAYALIDVETGKVVSAKSVRLFPQLFACTAAFVEPPQPGHGLPPVRMTLPDGASVRSDSADVDRVLAACFRREVRLSPAAADPGPGAPFFDLMPVSLLTTSTLRQLGEHRPESRFDERRFRMNVTVATREAGFVENHWVGRELELGEQARVRVTQPDSRCVMTTLAQGDLPHDAGVLRTLALHNALRIGDEGPYPCAGVYAVVAAPGRLRTGDRVAPG
jgi:uncharacterized protein YcbX